MKCTSYSISKTLP